MTPTAPSRALVWCHSGHSQKGYPASRGSRPPSDPDRTSTKARPRVEQEDRGRRGDVEGVGLAAHGDREAGQVGGAPLGRDAASPVAIKDCVRADGAPARTLFRAVRRSSRSDGDFTLVEVEPASGRKHQIRIHAAHAGHPIVGDKLYGGDETLYLRFVSGQMTEADERQMLLAHHALHAREMQFVWRGRAWTFVAPPEDAFRQFVS